MDNKFNVVLVDLATNEYIFIQIIQMIECYLIFLVSVLMTNSYPASAALGTDPEAEA